jgi:hypothetical protein
LAVAVTFRTHWCLKSKIYNQHSAFDYVQSGLSKAMATMMSGLKTTDLEKKSRPPPVVLDYDCPSCDITTNPASIGSLHNLEYYSYKLSKSENYSAASQLDVSEVVNGKMIDRELVNETQCRAYLDVSYQKFVSQGQR